MEITRKTLEEKIFQLTNLAKELATLGQQSDMRELSFALDACLVELAGHTAAKQCELCESYCLRIDLVRGMHCEQCEADTSELEAARQSDWEDSQRC